MYVLVQVGVGRTPWPLDWLRGHRGRYGAPVDTLKARCPESDAVLGFPHNRSLDKGTLSETRRRENLRACRRGGCTASMASCMGSLPCYSPISGCFVRSSAFSPAALLAMLSRVQLHFDNRRVLLINGA